MLIFSEFNTDYEEVDPPGTNHHMYEPLHNGTEKIQNNSKDFFSLHRIKSLRSKSASPKKSNNNTSEPVRNETEKIENNPIDFFSLHRNKSNRSKSMSPKKSIQSSDIDNLTEYDTDPGISFQSRSRFRERGPELTLEMASVNKKVMNDEKVDSAVLVGETSNLQRSYTSPSPKQNIVYYSDNTCELEFTKDMICELQKIQWRRISLDYGLSFPQ